MILFIGNFLSKHGLNPTAIEDLATALSNRYQIKRSSDKKNPFLRLLDMAMSVVINRKRCQLIIVDVFSTNAFFFSIGIISLAKIFNIPYSPVLRGGYLPKQYRKYPKIFIFLFSNASTIICPSKYLKRCFDNKNYTIKVIPNYIDLKMYSFKIRKEIKPQILWVRSLHNSYHPEMAIHVLEKIRKIYPDAKLCMVGPVKNNNIMDELIRLISRLNLQHYITFSGQLSKKEWIKLSEKFDIFINTTHIDNTPVTLLEAMALGLPIISTNVGGIPYLIDDGVTGLLIDPNDSDQMAGKINELISGKIDGYQITRNARKRVSILDKKRIIKQWYDIIDNAIHKRK